MLQKIFGANADEWLKLHSAELLYSRYEMAFGMDKRTVEFTLRSGLKTALRLLGSRGILTRAVSVCETETLA